MTELSASATALLKAAAVSGFVHVNSGGLSGAVAQKVRDSLVTKGLLEEVPHEGKGDLFNGKALKVTADGYAAIGAQKPATQGEGAASAPASAAEGASAAPAAAKARTPRENSKTAQLIALLRTTDGATVDEAARKFGWKPHTTRAAISTLPKKDAALKPTSDKVEGRGRVYRLPAA